MVSASPTVFLDANILISAGKPPGGPEITRIRNLVEAGLIQVVTTDLTIMEVAKHHANNDLKIMGDVTAPHVRKLIHQHLGVTLPDIKKGELSEKLRQEYRAEVKGMLGQLGAKPLSVDAISPSTVLDAYSSGEGFFAESGKKDQFPDAFAFEALKLVASEAEPVIVVSADKDFTHPASLEKHIAHVESLVGLFAHLGFQYDDAEVEDWLEEHSDLIVPLADTELSGWGLQGDVEDSEIDETTVTGVTIKKVTAAFKPTTEGDPILVLATIAALTTVSYSHPDWDNASYDSEDKVLIPWDTVSGETEIEVEIDVSLTVTVDDQGDPNGVEDISFRNDDFVYVTLHPVDLYDY